MHIYDVSELAVPIITSMIEGCCLQTMKLLNEGIYDLNHVTEYLRHKWPRKCSVCRHYNLALSLLLTCHRVS